MAVQEEFEKEFNALTEDEKNSIKGLAVVFKHLQKEAKFRIDLDKTVIYLEREEDIFPALVEHQAGFMNCCITDLTTNKSLFYPGMFTVKYYCKKCRHFHRIGIRCSDIAFSHLQYMEYKVIR